MTWFNKLPRLVQIILLLIPGVNWVVEIVVRWSTWLKKGGVLRLVICIIVTIPSGIIVGWLDMIWCLLFKKLCFQQEKNGRPRKFLRGRLAFFVISTARFTPYSHFDCAVYPLQSFRLSDLSLTVISTERSEWRNLFERLALFCNSALFCGYFQ